MVITQFITQFRRCILIPIFILTLLANISFEHRAIFLSKVIPLSTTSNNHACKVHPQIPDLNPQTRKPLDSTANDNKFDSHLASSSSSFSSEQHRYTD